MRAPWLRALAQWGFLAAIGTAGVAACGSRHTGGFTAATRTALPLGVYPASARMTQKYGIVEWRVFAGRSQLIITGFRSDGSPARGMQLASFKAVPGSPAHVRLMMLDGTGAAVRRTVTGAKTGTFSAFQNELLETMRYDLQRSQLPSGGALAGSAADGTGLHVLVEPAPGSGVRPADGVGVPGGTTPGTGPQCTAAWNDPQIVIDGSGCILGAATFEDVVGGFMALATCGQWYTGMQAANATCASEDSASCNTDSPPTCNFSPSSPEAGAAAPQSSCDTACLCANYPDTAQGCNTNYGPCSYDSDCSGGYTCQAGSSPSASHTCQAPQADAGAGGDDAGAGGDDAGAAAGDDGGAQGSEDDAGGAGPTGDDGGSGDPTSDPSGDDGGASDPEAPPSEQQVNDSADNTTCPSCQGAGSDLSADPQNGNVAVASPGSDPNAANPSTSDTADDPAGGSSGGGGGTGSNGGGSSGSSSTGSSSTGSSSGGDDGTGQASEDQPSQDQPSQDQSSQDQSSQDQPSQDQPSQDAQDQSAIRRLHHRKHKPSGWSRLYDRIAGWLRD